MKEMDMTRADELKEIMQAVVAGKYSEADFQTFKNEYGWAEWMLAYVESEDELISESEAKAIDRILKEGFRMAFDPQDRKLYGID